MHELHRDGGCKSQSDEPDDGRGSISYRSDKRHFPKTHEIKRVACTGRQAKSCSTGSVHHYIAPCPEKISIEGSLDIFVRVKQVFLDILEVGTAINWPSGHPTDCLDGHDSLG